jgi:hypothetical protein
MKYILFKENSVIMGDTGHWELLSSVCEPTQENADRLLASAGHCKLENGKIKVWGESATFGIKSREKDSEMIENLLYK